MFCVPPIVLISFHTFHLRTHAVFQVQKNSEKQYHLFCALHYYDTSTRDLWRSTDEWSVRPVIKRQHTTPATATATCSVDCATTCVGTSEIRLRSINLYVQTCSWEKTCGLPQIYWGSLRSPHTCGVNGKLSIYIQDLKNIKIVKGYRDGMPKKGIGMI